jgi:hypothetical protein
VYSPYIGSFIGLKLVGRFLRLRRFKVPGSYGFAGSKVHRSYGFAGSGFQVQGSPVEALKVGGYRQKTKTMEV